jgi:hypothetical protein
MRLLGAVVKEIRERRAQNYQEPLDSHAHSRRRRMSDDE